MTNGGQGFNMTAIHDAIDTQLMLVNNGFAPICPQLTTFCELLYPGRVPYADWLDLDLTFVQISDVVFRLPGESKGADGEVAYAHAHSIPVVYSYSELFEVFTLPKVSQ
jgi:hypothetical protein